MGVAPGLEGARTLPSASPVSLWPWGHQGRAEPWGRKNWGWDGREGVCLPLSKGAPSSQSSRNVHLVKLTTSRFFKPKCPRNLKPK